MSGCTAAQQTSAPAPSPVSPDIQIVQHADLDWGPLNPARGDNSPRAATLWGDRTSQGPSGFLVRFAQGFSSPPHIHNVTYRGMVIEGRVHNDDPEAGTMWMPSGSFWTQPAGEVHITAADAESNLAYIEIDDGPYLVLPADKAFDRGERPVNVDRSNIVWLDPPGLDFAIDSDAAEHPAIAYLWGTPRNSEPYGMLLKLPAAFTGTIRSRGSIFHAVVLQGRLTHRTAATSEGPLMRGSHFSSKGAVTHDVAATADSEVLIYVRTNDHLTLSTTRN